MKDNFSLRASDYARYRPLYPEGLYDWIFDNVNDFTTAWDAATGNGQIARLLADRFKKVFATDISREQLKHATPHERIEYGISSAEDSGLPDSLFNLISVGQAIHWFNQEEFYKEAQRVAAPGCLLVLVGYDLPDINMEVDAMLYELYNGILGPYWDPERKYIDERYQTLPFPFPELPVPTLDYTTEWTLDDFAGFLGTWSGLQHYRTSTGKDPLPEFISNIEDVWPADDTLTIRFPILLKAAYL